MHPVDKMKRRKLPSIKESENIPIDLEPRLFGGFNYSNGNPADYTLNDIICINRLYHEGVYDTLELADKFDLEERLIRQIIRRFDAGDFDKFLKNFKDLDVLDLKDIDFNSNNFTNEKLKKLDLFIFHKNLYKSDENICELLDLDIETIKTYLDYGKAGIMPYYKFYQEYMAAEERNALKEIEDDFRKSDELIKVFISYTYRGISMENISKLTGIDLEKVKIWLDMGKEGKEPFDKFYEDYLEAVEFRDNLR